MSGCPVPSELEWRMERAFVAHLDSVRAVNFGSTQYLYMGTDAGPFDDFPPLTLPGMVTGREVPVGLYYADFGIISRRKSGHEIRMAVECDGHNYHERTAAQARHDRARDRYFLANDIYTVRFTASEIFKDVDACVDEVINLAILRGLSAFANTEGLFNG